MIKVLIATVIFVISNYAHGSLDLAAGFGTTTSGRVAPALALSINSAGWSVGGFSTGIQTALYYHSGYLLTGLKTWEAGKMFGGVVQGGVGVGVYYAQRGYRSSVNSPLEITYDTLVGPAFRTRWQFVSSAYFGLDFLFGIRSPSLLLNLVGQDVTLVSLGVAL